MNKASIERIGQKYLNGTPLEIIRKTIGMCNEVYELKYKSDSFILRMNNEKEWLYGTHRFLPLFQQLRIKTPIILEEDYSKTEFPFCFQIQNKLEGKDLGLVIKDLQPAHLSQIAKEISSILDKFNTLPYKSDFGGLTGLNEEHYESLLAVFENHRKTIVQRNAASNVLGDEILEIHQGLLDRYKDYFLAVKPKLYYDDICSKNVMIHNGEFSGLVDLDFLLKGDYLEAIGRMISVWHGEEAGEFYITEIIRLQQLDDLQQEVLKVYAIFNLVLWTSEQGIRFNGNSTGEVNWANIERNKRKILSLYRSIA